MPDDLLGPSGGPNTPRTNSRREPEHGSISRYTGSKYRCRCALCTEAMREYRSNARAKKRAEAGLPPAEKKPDVWLDWSGITAVVRCELCNRNFGTWLSQAEGSAYAEAHRRWHAYTRKEYQGGTP